MRRSFVSRLLGLAFEDFETQAQEASAILRYPVFALLETNSAVIPNDL